MPLRIIWDKEKIYRTEKTTKTIFTNLLFRNSYLAVLHGMALATWHGMAFGNWSMAYHRGNAFGKTSVTLVAGKSGCCPVLALRSAVKLVGTNLDSERVFFNMALWSGFGFKPSTMAWHAKCGAV